MADIAPSVLLTIQAKSNDPVTVGVMAALAVVLSANPVPVAPMADVLAPETYAIIIETTVSSPEVTCKLLAPAAGLRWYQI